MRELVVAVVELQQLVRQETFQQEVQEMVMVEQEQQIILQEVQ
jgi:hypothetical protein